MRKRIPYPDNGPASRGAMWIVSILAQLRREAGEAVALECAVGMMCATTGIITRERGEATAAAIAQQAISAAQQA